MATVPWVAGIAHPTGFPAFVMLGWFWTHAIPIGSVAFRMSLFSAAVTSLAAGLIAWRIARAFDAPWVGMAAAWLFAFGSVTWSHATRPEVHALAALTIAATVVFALEWYRTRSEGMFFAAAAAWAVGLATQPVALLILPGLVTLLIARARAVRLRSLLAAVGLIAAIVIAAYAYLPLRSLYVTAHGLDPTTALGVPVGRPIWDYDHPSSPDGFLAEVSGSDFDVKQGLRSIVMPSIYLQAAREYLKVMAHDFTWIGVLLALAGVILGLVRDRWRAIGMLLCGFACIPFSLGYPQEADISRYFLTSFIIATLFVGEVGAWFASSERRLGVLVPLALAANAAWLVWAERPLFDQPNDLRARRLIDTVRQHTPDNAIIISVWTYATPIAYAIYVEHSMGNRTLDISWLDQDADFVPQWMRSRPVYVLDGSVGSVPGFSLQRVPAQFPISKVVRK
jgi:transmembrane protein TMEM260 (protein O-mannosyltransferase)